MEDKEKNFLSAVVYVHNAEWGIAEFLKMLLHVMEDSFEHSEIICVNDCSQDESVEKIREISASARTASISVLHLGYFHGLETAMNAGMELAIGDFVFEFDCIFADYDPSEMMRAYRRALEGYDIVSASSDRKEKVTSKIFYRVFQQFSEISCEMHTESFRVLSRRAVNRVKSMNRTVFYRKAVYANCGLKTDTVKYIGRKTVSGVMEKSERRYKVHLAVDALLLFTEAGYRFSVILTALMMFLAIFMTGYSLTVYLAAHPVSGWTTTILFLASAFFGLFAILTIIIKYLQLLINLVFKRKRYSFENIEKLTK